MLFVTNRMLRQSSRTRIGRNIDFDFRLNEAGQSVFFCERQEAETYIELGNENFFQALKESKYEQILFYIHGFSNLPEPHIFPTAEVLQTLFDRTEKHLVQVIPIIWPCGTDRGMVKEYWDDQQAADASAFAFARVYEKFMAWRESEANMEDPCLKRINVLAHSMGNRVFRGSIKAWGKYFRSYRLPLIFRNIFMVAADVVNESLEGLDGGLLCETARNVSVYFASDDVALRASKVANVASRVASRRLGHTGPEDISKVPKNVYAIDCDDVNSAYDPPLGHSYFTLDESRSGAGLVFQHIFHSVKEGRVEVGIPGLKTRLISP